jgi:predicted transcriptional regulator
MSTKAKIIALVAILCVFGLLVRGYLNQRDSAQKIGTKLEIAQEAISEAVETKKASARLTHRHAKEKAVALDSVGRILKETSKNAEISEICDGTVDDARSDELFNDAVSQINGIIANTGRVPE